MDHIAVIDVETTGLSPWRHDRVVEIAIVVMSPNGMIETEYETLVNPNRDIGPSSIHLVAFLCSDDPSLLDTFRLRNVQWPSVPALKTPCYRREHAREAREQPPRFLQRIASQIHHDVEAETPNVLAYLTLLERVLEDRTIDESEEDALVDAALNWHPTEQARPHCLFPAPPISPGRESL